MFETGYPALAAGVGTAWQHWLPGLLVAAAGLAVAYLLVGLASRQPGPERPAWSLWQKLVYLGTLLSVAILSLTAFGSLARYGELTGWPLLAHMVGAGLFVAVWPLLAITWAGPHASFAAGPAETPVSRTAFYWLPRACFWTGLAAGWVVAVTMLIGMLPLAGTRGQQQLLDLHRGSGWVVAVATLWHLAGVTLQWRGKR